MQDLSFRSTEDQSHCHHNYIETHKIHLRNSFPREVLEVSGIPYTLSSSRTLDVRKKSKSEPSLQSQTSLDDSRFPKSKNEVLFSTFSNEIYAHDASQVTNPYSPETITDSNGIRTETRGLVSKDIHANLPGTERDLTSSQLTSTLQSELHTTKKKSIASVYSSWASFSEKKYPTVKNMLSRNETVEDYRNYQPTPAISENIILPVNVKLKRYPIASTTHSDLKNMSPQETDQITINKKINKNIIGDFTSEGRKNEFYIEEVFIKEKNMRWKRLASVFEDKPFNSTNENNSNIDISSLYNTTVANDEVGDKQTEFPLLFETNYFSILNSTTSHQRVTINSYTEASVMQGKSEGGDIIQRDGLSHIKSTSSVPAQNHIKNRNNLDEKSTDRLSARDNKSHINKNPVRTWKKLHKLPFATAGNLLSYNLRNGSSNMTANKMSKQVTSPERSTVPGDARSQALSTVIPPLVQSPRRCLKCPYFLHVPNVIETAIGMVANFTCGVRNLGGRQVSCNRRELFIDRKTIICFNKRFDMTKYILIKIQKFVKLYLW